MNDFLSDITSKAKSTISKKLNWVGMEEIAIPVQVAITGEEPQSVSAKLGVFVSLDDQQAKGIHMSRLYLLVNEALANQIITEEKINALLRSLIQSQRGLSLGSKLTLSFDFTIEKPSLKSQLSGFQSYPITLTSQFSGTEFKHEIALDIPYSSTCPCSTSLARQAMADTLSHTFPDDEINKQNLLDWVQSQQGIVATPHSQRSFAYLNLGLKTNWPCFHSLIELIENTLVTALQTAVKREDEQAFAQLNAENLMFCEDAARRLKLCLDKYEPVENYHFKIEHQESLHAHNAVVYADSHR
ncbi:MAG: GTP cyclohydrolase FolE2 [Parashewanella sp.]